ncbi:hypothetical protein ABT373_13555 [Streptomyces sp. NPDC000070]|uniref:hypothetical protein n=1 Tax=Streptomyces sp. NPDC000070 TaxID=3154240 RepID=UPI00332238A9
MTGPHRLHPEDRADFQAVLRLALNTADMRAALLTDPSGRATARVRARARDEADDIAAGAEKEYAAFCAVRASAQSGPQHRPGHGTVLHALAVLTPVVAAMSAAALLLIGYVLQLTPDPGTLPASLVTAGWILALIAAVSALLALAALLRAAVRGRDGPATADRVEQARLTWQQALLERGMLPHVRRYVREDPALRTAAPPQGSRP